MKRVTSLHVSRVGVDVERLIGRAVMRGAQIGAEMAFGLHQAAGLIASMSDAR
jgi:hypothetical protein